MLFVLALVKAAAALQCTATAVDAGTPVQVRLLAVVVMAADAIVQAPIAVKPTPVAPN